MDKKVLDKLTEDIYKRLSKSENFKDYIKPKKMKVYTKDVVRLVSSYFERLPTFYDYYVDNDRKELDNLKENIKVKLEKKSEREKKRYISYEDISSYIARLATPYGYYLGCERMIKRFYDQFKKGSGGELNDKFWKRNSSSRLCFDLYSCLAEKPQVRDIEFEYKLPGIYSTNSPSSANMDVYIKTEDCIFFIESKFTETADKNKNYGDPKDGLPQAYWNPEKYYLSTNGERVQYPKSIAERFTFAGVKTAIQVKQLEMMCDQFPVFCTSIKDLIEEFSKEDYWRDEDWFDAKQETCHIFGILLYAIKYQPKEKIEFYNIVFDKREPSDLAKEFVKLAEGLFDNILGEGKVTYNIYCKIGHILDKVTYNIDCETGHILDLYKYGEKGFAPYDIYLKDLICKDLKNLYDAYTAEILSSDSGLEKRIGDGEHYDFPDDDAILVKNLSVKALMDKT